MLAVEMKDMFTRYTNDVIATSAFGIQVDSLKSPKNEFYLMGKDVTNFQGVRALIFFGYMMCPKLMKVRMSVLYPQYIVKAVNYLNVYTMFLLTGQPALRLFNNFKLSLTFCRLNIISFIQGVSPNHSVNTFHHGYKNQSMKYNSKIAVCLETVQNTHAKQATCKIF
jgi:hypothetical protein